VLIPLASAFGAVGIFSPRLWQSGASDVVVVAERLTSFPWVSTIDLFGASFTTNDLPWWYALPWPLVHMPPVVLVIMLAGFGFLFSRRNNRPSLAFGTTIGRISVPFEAWLGAVLLLSWITLLVVQPTLYDEERQILFLYPLLALLGALGLAAVPRTWQTGLILCCVVASLWSYGQWGPYSYVYSSPVAGRLGYQSNLGDYNALCMNRGIAALPEHLSPETVVYAYPIQLASLQDLHLRHRRVFPRRDFPQYNFVQNPPEPPFAALVAHRGIQHQTSAVDVAQASETLWSETLPTEEVTCTLTWHE
jgi:hypothetical protein